MSLSEMNVNWVPLISLRRLPASGSSLRIEVEHLEIISTSPSECF